MLSTNIGLSVVLASFVWGGSLVWPAASTDEGEQTVEAKNVMSDERTEVEKDGAEKGKTDHRFLDEAGDTTFFGI